MLRAGDDGQPRPFGGYGGPGGSAAQLAGVLATLLHRPVLDQTGITYEFSYDVSFARPEEDCAACPTVSGALQDQLGLKLDSSRAPVEVLTVDHVEQPSEN
jgi:uncharacterized protein (TIGR03435 family)